MRDSRIYSVWLTGPQLRKRWGDMANSTFYDRLKRGLIPAPEYPFGPGKPYFRASQIEALENSSEQVAA